jgi:hypothetical protein
MEILTGSVTIPSLFLSVVWFVDSIFASKSTGCSPNTLDFVSGTTMFFTVEMLSVKDAMLRDSDGKDVLHLIIFTRGV